MVGCNIVVSGLRPSPTLLCAVGHEATAQPAHRLLADFWYLVAGLPRSSVAAKQGSRMSTDLAAPAQLETAQSSSSAPLSGEARYQKVCTEEHSCIS